MDGGLERGSVYVFVGSPGMLFFFPLGSPATWRMMGMRPRAHGAYASEEAGDPSLEDLQAISDAYTGGQLRLRDPAWVTYFRLHRRQAARYRAGRVFLAGDAAHVHSPAGAQGMNTGIQDAWNLGWKLALVTRGVADPALLDSYEAERYPIGRVVLRFTDRAFSIATSDSPLVRLMRAHVAPRVAPLMLRFGRRRAFGFRTVSQLGIHYRRSPAVEEGRPPLRRGPKAGDRLPDARIVHDGRACWLQEALSGPTFQLVLCGPTDSWDGGQLAALRERYAGLVAVHHLAREAARRALHDRDGQAFGRLGVERAAQFLVRPGRPYRLPVGRHRPSWPHALSRALVRRGPDVGDMNGDSGAARLEAERKRTSASVDLPNGPALRRADPAADRRDRRRGVNRTRRRCPLAPRSARCLQQLTHVAKLRVLRVDPL